MNNTKETMEERFDNIFTPSWELENSSGEYGLTAWGWDEIKSFIKSEIDLALKEERARVQEAMNEFNEKWNNLGRLSD